MLTAALVLGAVLAVAAVWFVARPFLTATTESERLEAPDAGRLDLVERRDRALAALKELEFDHRTGKVSDEDYRQQVGELRRAAAEALRALDAGTQNGMTQRHSAGNGVELPPNVPEPEPVPHEPPGPVIVPEPEPPRDRG